MPNRSTMYHARPNDPAAVRRQAGAFRANEYVRDFAPPVLLRVIAKLRGRLLSRRKAGAGSRK
ncbi:MAG: hypothetical protein H0X25_17965 [Acidobacteriales bacterium]|nr:hypothetical protein [Terriglobales bacterium]